MFPEDKKNKKSRKSGAPDDAPPAPVDVFVDTIIGFLEKSTAYMRSVGNQVFALLSAAVQVSTIDLIVTVCISTHMSCTSTEKPLATGTS